MRKLWLPSLVGSWLIFGGLLARAQQPDASPAPAATPQPPPAAAEPPPYSLDLPDLPSTNGAGLFPSGSRPSPSPTATGNNSSSRSGNTRSKFFTGSRTHGRALDRTLQKADSDSLDVRVAYRRAKTEALARDPELVEWMRRADSAQSDEEKHACLREYYTRLFAQVRRIDSSSTMKAHVDLLAQIAAQQYAPNRRVVAGEEDLLNGRDVSRGWIGR